MKILIIDDDKNYIDLISDYLNSFEIEVISATTFEEGRQKILIENPDHVLVDIRLPGRSGLDIVNEFSGKSDIKFYVLTADINNLESSVLLDGIILKDDLISGLRKILNARRYKEVS